VGSTHRCAGTITILVPSPVSSLLSSPTVVDSNAAGSLDKSARLSDAGYDPVVEADELEKILELSRHDREGSDREATCGVVWGLVVTGMGEGELMPIESIATPGSGNLKLTGFLGGVRVSGLRISDHFLLSFVDVCLGYQRERGARAQLDQEAPVRSWHRARRTLCAYRIL
jgi:hypothetical protein